MIKFNNVDIDTIANVKIEDVRPGPIALSVVSRKRPILFGSDFVRMSGTGRSVAITFALLDDTRSSRLTALDSITKWARSDQEGKLELSDKSGVYLSCICTGLPEPSMRQWWESKLRLIFTTVSNPYWTSTTEKTASFGTAFTVNGSAPPLMQLKRTLSSAASNQSYSDGTNTMTFSTIPAGNLVIDLNQQTAAVGSTSIMQYYTFSSKFIIPKAGTQTLTGNGTIYYRERWE